MNSLWSHNIIKVVVIIFLGLAIGISNVIAASNNKIESTSRIYIDSRLSDQMANSWKTNLSFSPPVNISSQIRQWELNSAYNLSNAYANKMLNNLRPWPGLATHIGSELTVRRVGDLYSSMGQTYNEIANIYRSAAADSANRIADIYMWRGFSPNSLGNVYSLSQGNIYAPNFAIWLREGYKYRDLASSLSRPTTDALYNAAWGRAVYNDISTFANLAISGIDRFIKTVDYVGTSMQIMNPPIYLQNRPELGQFANFTPSQKALFIIPITGTWQGYGSHSIPYGNRYYQEKLSTAWPESITKIHIDLSVTNFGREYRRIEIKTPTLDNFAGSFERFAVTHYPTNSYWDPQRSTMTVTTDSFSAWRETTKHGYTTISPVNNFSSNYQQFQTQQQSMWNQIRSPMNQPPNLSPQVYRPQMPQMPKINTNSRK